MSRRINLVIPDPDEEVAPGDKVTPLFIEPEGKIPGRETPGFFVMKIGDAWVFRDSHEDEDPKLPRQFLSLQAVHEFLFERYGNAPPLHVTKYLVIDRSGAKDFPAIWGGTRGKGRDRVTVQVRYIGSFRYWDQRRVDPTKVGTEYEFN